jgi:uncharacterized protein YdiU (UPF0061 family)
MLRRLGFAAGLTADSARDTELPDPVPPTLQLLAAWPVAYGSFFTALAERIAAAGLPANPDELVPFVQGAPEPSRAAWIAWRDAWWAWSHATADPASIGAGLRRWNLPETPVRPLIERLWEAIDSRDDWVPLHDWLAATTG